MIPARVIFISFHDRMQLALVSDGKGSLHFSIIQVQALATIGEYFVRVEAHDKSLLAAQTKAQVKTACRALEPAEWVFVQHNPQSWASLALSS